MTINRNFLERLHKQLDSIGLPLDELERSKVFAKLFKVNKPLSSSILAGRMMPNAELLQAIANELEVSPDWLLGHDKAKESA